MHPAADDVALLVLRALPTTPEPLHVELGTDPTLLSGLRHRLGGWLRRAGAMRHRLAVQREPARS